VTVITAECEGLPLVAGLLVHTSKLAFFAGIKGFGGPPGAMSTQRAHGFRSGELFSVEFKELVVPRERTAYKPGCDKVGLARTCEAKTPRFGGDADLRCVGDCALETPSKSLAVNQHKYWFLIPPFRLLAMCS